MGNCSEFGRLLEREDYEALVYLDREIMVSEAIEEALVDAGLERPDAVYFKICSGSVGKNGAPGDFLGLWQDYGLRDSENRRAFGKLLEKARGKVGGGLDEAAMDYLAWVRRCLFRDTVEEACLGSGIGERRSKEIIEAFAAAGKREFAEPWERVGRANPDDFMAFSDKLSKSFLKWTDDELGELKARRQSSAIDSIARQPQACNAKPKRM